MTEQPRCELCGEPMPLGEEMFKYHGYSGPCPKSPLTTSPVVAESSTAAAGERLIPTCDLAEAIEALDASIAWLIQQDMPFREGRRFVRASAVIDVVEALLDARTPPASTQTDGTFEELLNTLHDAIEKVFEPHDCTKDIDCEHCWDTSLGVGYARNALLAHVARLEEDAKRLDQLQHIVWERDSMVGAAPLTICDIQSIREFIDNYWKAMHTPYAARNESGT